MNRSHRFDNERAGIGLFDLYLLFLLFYNVKFNPLNRNDWGDRFNDA